jgi:hypothetical protein
MELETKQIDNCFYAYNIQPGNYSLLKIPENVENVYIQGHYLDHFEIPENIKNIELIHLGLKTLIIPEGVISVNCSKNFLKTIEIPQSLKVLKINKNLLSEITFRSSIDNQLEHLAMRSNIVTNLEYYPENKLDHFNKFILKINQSAPRIRNWINMEHMYEPSSPDSSDDEYSELNVNKS